MRPVSKTEIGSDDHGIPFMEGRTELEEKLIARRRERDEAEFVEDDETELESGSEKLGEQLFILCLSKVIDQSSGIIEACSMTLATSRQGKTDARWVLPKPGWPTMMIGSARVI